MFDMVASWRSAIRLSKAPNRVTLHYPKISIKIFNHRLFELLQIRTVSIGRKHIVVGRRGNICVLPYV